MPNVLSEQSYKSYKSLSRYMSVPYYYNSVDNKYIMSTTRHLKDTTPYTNYTVQEGDNIDIIANEQYKDAGKYWIILDFNKIQNPFDELVPGTVLKIPSIPSLEWEDN